MRATKVFILTIILFSFVNSTGAESNENINDCDTLKFVSFPDFFNFDIPEPWPDYDTAVDYFLTQVKNENPDFVLIAGDLVNGHWWDSPQCVEHMGTVYYSGWVRRLNRYGLKYFTAVGDHELGDDPWPPEKIKLIPYFEEIYRKILDMPQNGPEGKKGLAYYYRENDLLLITVETFEVVSDTMNLGVIGEQLDWLKKVLSENQDAKFKIVQGHVPIWGNINARSSSKLMLNGGKESEFYKTLRDYNVDLYLAGEFHDVTILQSEGIWQIVHGSSWGREIVNTLDYLVGELCGNQLKLTMKRIYIDAQGEYMWNLNKDRGPREKVRINDKTLLNGPEITGTLTIIKDKNEKIFTERTGYFNE
ncbi:metallophosphoesterase family protein [Melioribacter sp. OK-6-Me]|uniref:metallophosphoesterase family protein n=1 Tax=unclassified Melioribacter TaxID=2627329 RepID=UPI003ED98594